MKEILLFVHIPKTAGTSLRKSLERTGEVRMFYDYGPNPETSSILLKNLNAEGRIDDESIFEDGRVNVICGHLRFQKYAKCVRPWDVFSILRNPVERLVSEYQHLRRNAGLSIGFADFISQPQQMNKQSRMLNGVDIEGGGIFGLTSHYSWFLELINRRYGTALASRALNKAPDSDHRDRFSLSVEDIGRAFDLNRPDLELFFAVARRFSDELRDAGFKVVPDDAAKLDCRLDGSRRLIGWVSREGSECLFLELSVNGQPRAIAAVDQEREDVVRRGLSANSRCGFSYPLNLLGVQPDDEVGVKVIGAPRLAKSLSIPKPAFVAPS